MQQSRSVDFLHTTGKESRCDVCSEFLFSPTTHSYHEIFASRLNVGSLLETRLVLSLSRYETLILNYFPVDMVSGLDHVNIATDDKHIKVLVRFYCELIGMVEGPRPALAGRHGGRGVWLYGSHPRALIHVDVIPMMPREGDGCDSRTGLVDGSSRLNHFALNATELNAVTQRFEAACHPYRLDRQEATNMWQLFTFDPVGVKVELVFSSLETLEGEAALKWRQTSAAKFLSKV